MADLPNSGVHSDPTLSAIDVFQTQESGQSGGRQASIGTSASLPLLFDEDLYLLFNPDIADAVRTGKETSGASHWLIHGRVEELSGLRPIIKPQDHLALEDPGLKAESERYFDWFAYADAYPDTRNFDPGNLRGTEQHWQLYGKAEGRAIGGLQRIRDRTSDVVRLLRKPFGVNYFAPLTAQCGLGMAARGYLRALRTAGIPVHLHNIELDGSVRRSPETEIESPYRINIICINADALEPFYNLFPKSFFDDRYNIAIWSWELSVIRPDWFKLFSTFDEVWTPSDYVTESIRIVSPVPVMTVNHVVERACAIASSSRPEIGLPEGFLFLTTFDADSTIDRKNPDAVIDSFVEAFADRTDVHLVVNYYSAHRDTAAVRKLIRKCRGRNNILVRSGLMTREQIDNLEAASDCFVSSHRSEAFGLKIAEMMLNGKPVIVTGYSGNMDFCSAKNSYPVSYSIVELSKQAGPYLKGYTWADINVVALADAMRSVVANPDRARAIGDQAAKDIGRQLSAGAIGAVISKRFKTLGLDGAPVPEFVLRLGRSRDSLPTDIYSGQFERVRLPESPIVISVIVPVYNVDAKILAECVESVRNQTYPHWEICLCDDASTSEQTVNYLRGITGVDPRIRVKHLAINSGISGASNAAVTMATGEWLLMLDNDDLLTLDALQTIVDFTALRDYDVIYSDEDKLNEKGEFVDTYFKPDWSPEHLESVMYTLHPVTIRKKLFLELGGFRSKFTGAQDWDLMLRVSRHTDRIGHIPKILYHWRMVSGSASADIDAKPEVLNVGKLALADHVLEKYGALATVENAPLHGHYRVRHRIATQPPVSIVITTDNRSVALDGRKPFVMVENLVKSIAEKSSYKNYQIKVVDNGKSSSALKKLVARIGGTIVTYPGPQHPFNYAKKANFAILGERNEHVVMMNDDMEVISKEWLEALLEFSQRPEVGLCAGKLLHADGTIQHVGTVLGVNDSSAHVYHGFPGDFVGYNSFTHVIRNYSAMTGACIATRLSVLQEVGGWDEEFAIDYNDVDLCLKIRAQGYRIVYTPYSEMYHFEGKTAVRQSQNPAEVALFRKRWGDILENDPYYNPNLSRKRHDYYPAYLE